MQMNKPMLKTNTKKNDKVLNYLCVASENRHKLSPFAMDN